MGNKAIQDKGTEVIRRTKEEEIYHKIIGKMHKRLLIQLEDIKEEKIVKNNLEKCFFNLPQNVLFKILSFSITNYFSLIQVSPLWFFKIQEIFEDELIKLDNDFIKQNIQILSLKQSYNSTTPIKFAKKKGFRMDRNILSEVLPKFIGKEIIYVYFFFVLIIFCK